MHAPVAIILHPFLPPVPLKPTQQAAMNYCTRMPDGHTQCPAFSKFVSLCSGCTDSIPLCESCGNGLMEGAWSSATHVGCFSASPQRRLVLVPTAILPQQRFRPMMGSHPGYLCPICRHGVYETKIQVRQHIDIVHPQEAAAAMRAIREAAMKQ